jgi:hypothetical protein
MFYQRLLFLCLSVLSLAGRADVTADNTSLAVWSNEAIVSTYTFNYQNFLDRQKDIAQYFTATGWINYTKAFNASQLPEAVKKNQYDVSAVATMPPQIKQLHSNYWQAIMPVLVVYKNPQYTQKQTLEVTLEFTASPSGQGVRGLAITSLQSKIKKPACQCMAN